MQLLVVVKAYPNPSRKYGETSCIAGIELDGESPKGWIRLYPVPYRALEDDQKFRKYEVVELDARRPRNDRRPETLRPNLDTLRATGRFLPSRDGWRQRRPFIEPLMDESMCEIARRQEFEGISLGIFRPREITDLAIKEVDVELEKRRLAELSVAQGSLLDSSEREYQRKAIEQLPYAFKYAYRCLDAGCRGHEQTIVDWELAQFYRQVKHTPDWTERVRRKWLGELGGPGKDTALIVGNQFMYPRSFLVLGVWWPPKEPEQLRLG